MKKELLYLASLCILLLGQSGTQAQNFAKEFVALQSDTVTSETIYVGFTDRIMHTNSTINSMPGFDELDSTSQAQLRDKYTLVLDKVHDDILLSEFRAEFLSTLSTLGFKVVECNPQDFPAQLKTGEHTLSIAQLELEEYMSRDSLATNQYGQHITYDKLLNGLRWNTWLLFDQADSTSRQMFFADDETTDDFFGYIEQDNGQYYVNYQITKINPNDAYLLARSNAEICGRYLFNFLMNKYVWLKSEGSPTYYYSIDHNGTILYDDQAFDNFDIIPMNEE